MREGDRVTVVIATHNRPDTLHAAIESVKRQTLACWTLLVIGDCCDERTGEVVGGFDDPRIRYVNLPKWSGEQAGPNSVGMTLAETPFIALLNHDDVWLQDHLERALSAMGDADFFIARSAVADRFERLDDGRITPSFEALSDESIGLDDVYVRSSGWFEPCSAWVFRRELVQRVGVWLPARTLHRVPIEDWLLRAWRAGVRLEVGDVPTVLQIRTYWERSSAEGAYRAASPEHRTLEEWLAHDTPEAIRERVFMAVSKAPARSPGTGARHLRERLIETAGWFYLHTGVDPLIWWWRARGRGRGVRLGQFAQRRTGRPLPDPPGLSALLQHAKDSLANAR